MLAGKFNRHVAFGLKGIALLSLLLLASGCWGQRNIAQLTVVAAIGLDAAPDNQIELSIQLVNPKLSVAAGGSGQRRPFALYTAVGSTVYEAIDGIRKQAKKELFFPQTRTIIIGETLAKRGIGDYMDFFWRDMQQNPISSVLISRLSVRELLQQSQELVEIPADEWVEFFRNRENPADTLEMYEFLPRLEQVGYQAFAAGLTPKSKEEKEIVTIDEVAVFKKDKLVGWLSEPEVQVFEWLRGDSKGSVVKFALDDQVTKPIVFELETIRVRKAPRLRNQQIEFSIDIHVDASLKSSVKPLDLSSFSSNDLLEKELEEHIKSSVKRIVARINQEFNSDIIGFGQRIYQTYPHYWKEAEPQWNEELARMNVDVNVTAHIIKAGLRLDKKYNDQ